MASACNPTKLSLHDLPWCHLRAHGITAVPPPHLPALPLLELWLTGDCRAPTCPQACPSALVPYWPTRYRSAVQTLLLCVRRGRATAAPTPEAGEQPHAAAATGGSAGCHGGSQQDPVSARQLAQMPRDVLLRIAVLAAAPLSAW